MATRRGHDADAMRAPTGSVVPHLLLAGVQVAAFASPRFRGRRVLFAAAIVGTFAWSQVDPHVFDDLQHAQPLSIEWCNMLSSLEKTLFATPSPEAALYRIDRGAGEALALPAFGLAKLRWALVLLTNMRGIRWNFQVRNVPAVRYASRAQWLRTTALDVLYYALMADLTGALSRRLFYTTPDGRPGRTDGTLLHPDPRVSFGKALVFGATPYYMLSFQYTLMGLVAVVLRVSRPEDWPAHFGALRDAWTVRAFWGKYWHQTLRRSLTAFSGALVDGLGIRRGTHLSSYTQLWFVFLLSGIMHANGNRAMPRPASLSLAALMGGWIAFFVWQAAAITLEDGVQAVWRRWGGAGGHAPGWARTLGYAWVAGNLWWSLPWIGDITLGLRMFEAPLFPVSVCEPLVRAVVPIP